MNFSFKFNFVFGIAREWNKKKTIWNFGAEFSSSLWGSITKFQIFYQIMKESLQMQKLLLPLGEKKINIETFSQRHSRVHSVLNNCLKYAPWGIFLAHTELRCIIFDDCIFMRIFICHWSFIHIWITDWNEKDCLLKIVFY